MKKAYFANFFKNRNATVFFSIILSFLFIAVITYAGTTISTNINTGGTLVVSGASNLAGAIWASSTLQTTGAARFYGAARIDGATTLNGVSYIWPSSDGSASTYLQTNGAGTLSWATVSSGASSDWLKQTNYGVLNLTASTTLPYWAKDAIYASSTLQVQGLTTLGYASTTAITITGTASTTNLVASAMTSGSVLFSGAGGLLSQDNSNLFWDDTNNRLGVGTTSPWAQFSVNPNGITGPAFAVGSSTQTNFVVTNGGKVGIGTAAPITTLHLDGTQTELRIEDDNLPIIYFYDDTTYEGAISTNGADMYVTSVTGNLFLGTDVTNMTLEKTSSKVGIGTTTPRGLLGLNDPAGVDSFVVGSGTPKFIIKENGNVGIGTTTPTEQLSVSNRLFVGGTGTSTIQNNLYVMGTLRSTVSYVGDLIFSNNFRFIETPPNEKIQSLFLQNQNGENIFKINEKGQVAVREIQTEKGKFKKGIVIYDKDTQKPYCIEIRKGQIVSEEGECE